MVGENVMQNFFFFFRNPISKVSQAVQYLFLYFTFFNCLFFFFPNFHNVEIGVTVLLNGAVLMSLIFFFFKNLNLGTIIGFLKCALLLWMAN